MGLGRNENAGTDAGLSAAVHRVLDHAARWHGDTEILSRSVEGPLHRIAYRDVNRGPAPWPAQRSGVLARARHGDRHHGWNTWRHLETWYGIMGVQGIVHTLNPRLFDEQLIYIINHAGDRWIFTDLTFLRSSRGCSPTCRRSRALWS